MPETGPTVEQFTLEPRSLTIRETPGLAGIKADIVFKRSPGETEREEEELKRQFEHCKSELLSTYF
jgi:hypothetical protein